MRNTFAALALVLLGHGVAHAGYGDRIAVCKTDITAANHYEVYQMYLGPNSYSYFVRNESNQGKSIGLIGPDVKTDFNSSRTEMTIDFGALGFDIKKGIDQKGTVRGLLVPNEAIVCTADWQ